MQKKLFSLLSVCLIGLSTNTTIAAKASQNQVKFVNCDLLVVGGGFSGAATAYEALLSGKIVCMTEITDWVGGQVSAQGVSALDERATQREQLFFPRGYLEFRDRIKQYYGKLNVGECWVSVACFLPKDGHKILTEMLQDAEKKGKGQLKWFPNTVAKDLTTSINGKQITQVTAIKHQPQLGTPPLNTEPLSQIIEDIYNYQDSARLKKEIIQFVPNLKNKPQVADWYVIDATETGEIVGLADVPYRLGIDPRSSLEPSSSTPDGDPYCTQGFTYTFAMETTKDPQPQTPPPFYNQYAPYYSYELPRLADFGLVHTYRRIFSPVTGERRRFGGIGYTAPKPGDISMQNWTWGNDFRPGGSNENLILTREQLSQTGQLSKGGWLGGLRTDTLRKGEEISLGYYYWLVAGDTDSQLGQGVKKPEPNHRLVTGLDSPMGTVHGLSKYPYIREGRRIIGRPSYGYDSGFMIKEVDISRNNLPASDKIKGNLSPEEFTRLQAILSGTSAIDVLTGGVDPNQVKLRGRSTVFPDSVGIGHYAIDFHPCMQKSPPELPGNTERINGRDGQGEAYPFQIPLRSMIPQKIDNLLIAGKSIAASHVAAAAYRVHSFEWSVGAAAGNTSVFSLEKGVLPYELVDDLPNREPLLLELQKRLENQNNPTYFPGTSILNSNWEKWR